MTDRSEQYNGDMEAEPKRTILAYFAEPTRNALLSGDATRLLEAVEQGDDPMLQNLGLRLQIRDFWRNSKGALAGATEESSLTDIRRSVRTFADTIDHALESLIGYDKNGQQKDTQTVASERLSRLYSELARLSPQAALERMRQLTDLPTGEFMHDEELIRQTIACRSGVLNVLWQAEGGELEEFKLSAETVNDYIDDYMMQLSGKRL